MKRNFLLMLLLTLLPLVSWAATDLSVAKLSVRNVPYGTAALVAGNAQQEVVGPGAPANPESDFRTSWDRDLVLDTDFTWNGKYYSNQACTTEVTDLATAPVGTYYVKFVGIEFFQGEVVCPFQILKRKLYVSVKGEITEAETETGWTAGGLFTTFGVPFDLDDIEGVEDYEGLVNHENFDDVVEGEITAITTEETDANADDEGHALIGANPYTATLEGLTSQNYEIICVNPFYIKKKNISDGEGLTFALPVKSATYNGMIQEAAYKITYGNAVLVQGEDFTVSYGPENKLTTFGEGADQVTGPVNVYDYATVITGTGNFTGSYPNETLEEEDYDAETFVWSIKPYGLTIITKNQTKVYNGQTGLPSGARDVAYEVLLPYHLSNYDGLGLDHIKLTPQDKDEAGEYTISADIDGIYRNNNYDYNFVNEGKFTITKRNMTITVGEIEKTYNANDNLATATITFTPELEKDENGDDIAWTIPTSDEKNERYSFVKGTYNNNDKPYAGADLKVSRKESGENIGDYAITVTVSDAQKGKGRLKNYNITKINDGVLHIMGGKIYVTALSTEKNYGEDDPETFAYRVDGLVGDDKLATYPTLTREGAGTEEGEAVGQYRIVPTGAVAPANYKDIVYADGKFTINKRPITLTALNQTFKVGDKVSTFDKEAYTIDNEDPTEGLAPGDKASDLFELQLVRGVEGNEEQMEVTPRNALYKFESHSAEEGGWLMAHGVVEVTGQIPGQFATVVVRRNIADNATTGGQANAFKDKTFYVENTNTDGRKKLYDQVKYDPEDGEFELTQSPLVEGVWVKIGQEVRSAVESNNAVYVFGSFSKESDEVEGDVQYGHGAVELLGYDEGNNRSEIVVKQNFAVGATDPAEAADFVGQHFYVVGNPADGIPEGRLQLIAQAPNPDYSADAAAAAEEEGEEYNVPQYTAGLAQQIWVEIVACVKEATDAVESVDGVKTTGTGKKEVFALGEDETYGEYNPGVIFKFNNAIAANYDIVDNPGTVWVIPADALVLDRDDADLAAKIEAADGENKFIAFKGITLKASRWNTLVLPFDTSVEELSNVFGYSVVDMLDENNTNANTITISLAFGDIPANTPFLIQPKKDVVLSDGIFFFNTPVVYSENPVAEDGANHKLVGTYTGVSIEANSADKYVYQPTLKEFRHPGANGANLKPLMAYLQDETGAATRIFIQEPDGENTVTAIGEIAAEVENEAQATDGWYSVSGMKLNAAPTQKGIFIKDGKKFLIAK